MSERICSADLHGMQHTESVAIFVLMDSARSVRPMIGVCRSVRSIERITAAAVASATELDKPAPNVPLVLRPCGAVSERKEMAYLAAGRIDDGVHQQNDLLLVGAELRTTQSAGRHVHGHNVAGRHHCRFLHCCGCVVARCPRCSHASSVPCVLRMPATYGPLANAWGCCNQNLRGERLTDILVLVRSANNHWLRTGWKYE